jgi:hypothetical protein
MSANSVEIDESHPHFNLIRALNGERSLVYFVRSSCLYESPILAEPAFKCHLQIALAERLLLFGQNPQDILAYDLLYNDYMMSLKSDVREQVELEYAKRLIEIYRAIIASRQ